MESFQNEEKSYQKVCNRNTEEFERIRNDEKMQQYLDSFRKKRLNQQRDQKHINRNADFKVDGVKL